MKTNTKVYAVWMGNELLGRIEARSEAQARELYYLRTPALYNSASWTRADLDAFESAYGAEDEDGSHSEVG